jgi:hypothetical protein
MTRLQPSRARHVDESLAFPVAQDFYLIVAIIAPLGGR